MTTKDIVREVLEKDPKERTDEDLDILFEFMQSFPVIFLFCFHLKINTFFFQFKLLVLFSLKICSFQKQDCINVNKLQKIKLIIYWPF